MAVSAYSRRLPQSLSATALDSYQRCPREFALSYLTAVADSRLPTPPLVLGNVVHSACASLMALDPTQRTEDTAHRLVRQHWLTSARTVFIHRDEERAWGERALTMTSAMVGSGLAEGEPHALEEWVRATLPGGKRVCGRIDRADRTPEGLEIIDYKTGRRPDDFQARDETAARLYALCCFRTFRMPVACVKFLWLAEGQIDGWRPHRDDLCTIEDELAELCEQLTTDRTMAPRPSGGCTGCGFRSHCPAAGPAPAPQAAASALEALPF